MGKSSSKPANSYEKHGPFIDDLPTTWWLIPLTLVITLVISGISGGNVHL